MALESLLGAGHGWFEPRAQRFDGAEAEPGLRIRRSLLDELPGAGEAHQVTRASRLEARSPMGYLSHVPSAIEEYAILADCQSVALVAKNGSIDWMCLPYFDSGACFAALLGTPDNGRWLICPVGDVKTVRRQYRGGTMVLETEYETEGGSVTLIDLMPIRTRPQSFSHVSLINTALRLAGSQGPLEDSSRTREPR